MANIAPPSAFRAEIRQMTLSDAQLEATRGRRADEKSNEKSGKKSGKESITPLKHFLHKVFYRRGVKRTQLLTKYSRQRSAKAQSVIKLMGAAKRDDKRAARKIAPQLDRMGVRKGKVCKRAGGDSQFQASLFDKMVSLRNNKPEEFRTLLEFVDKNNASSGYALLKTKTDAAKKAMSDIETSAALADSVAVLSPLVDAVVDSPSNNMATAALAELVAKASAVSDDIGTWARSRPSASMLVSATIAKLDDKALATFARHVHAAGNDPRSGIAPPVLATLRSMTRQEGETRLNSFVSSRESLFAVHLDKEKKDSAAAILKDHKAKNPYGSTKGSLKVLAQKEADALLSARHIEIAHRLRDQAIAGAFVQKGTPGQIELDLLHVAQSLRDKIDTLGAAMQPGGSREAQLNALLTQAFKSLLHVDLRRPKALGGSSNRSTPASSRRMSESASVHMPNTAASGGSLPSREAPPPPPTLPVPPVPSASTARPAQVTDRPPIPWIDDVPSARTSAGTGGNASSVGYSHVRSSVSSGSSGFSTDATSKTIYDPVSE